jgi:hypothetical protein
MGGNNSAGVTYQCRSENGVSALFKWNSGEARHSPLWKTLLNAHQVGRAATSIGSTLGAASIT